jgi:hypothetical protein
LEAEIKTKEKPPKKTKSWETTFKNNKSSISNRRFIGKWQSHSTCARRAKVAVADWKKNDEMVDLIKELGSEAITLSNATSKNR